MALFQLDRARAKYNGTAVLHDISLSIEAGERVSLIGASGSGKSTLLGLLYRQQRLAAYVPQDPSLVKSLSVFHNTFMGRLEQHSSWYNLLNLAWPLSAEVERITELLDSLGLAEKRFEPTGELSGGQQQRTAIARALYRGSKVLLADEPVSSVDPSQAQAVMKQIVGSHETVVLAMHDISLALEFTDRVVGLREGRIVFDRPSQSITPDELMPFFQS